MLFRTPGEDLVGDGQGEHGGAGRQGRLMRIGGWIDLESKLTVSAWISRILIASTDA